MYLLTDWLQVWYQPLCALSFSFTKRAWWWWRWQWWRWWWWYHTGALGGLTKIIHVRYSEHLWAPTNLLSASQLVLRSSFLLASYRFVYHTEWGTCQFLISPGNIQGIQVVSPINPRAIFEIHLWWRRRTINEARERREVTMSWGKEKEIFVMERKEERWGQRAPSVCWLAKVKGQRLIWRGSWVKKKYSKHEIRFALGVILF